MTNRMKIALPFLLILASIQMMGQSYTINDSPWDPSKSKNVLVIISQGLNRSNPIIQSGALRGELWIDGNRPHWYTHTSFIDYLESLGLTMVQMTAVDDGVIFLFHGPGWKPSNANHPTSQR